MIYGLSLIQKKNNYQNYSNEKRINNYKRSKGLVYLCLYQFSTENIENTIK